MATTIEGTAVAATEDAAFSESEGVYRAYLSYQDLVRGGQVTPSWILNGPSFWYADGGPQDRMIWRVDPETNTKEPLFDVARLRMALTDALGEEPAGRGVPFVRLVFVGERSVKFALEGADWRIDLDSYAVERLPALSVLPPLAVLVSESERAIQSTFNKWTYPAGVKLTVPERLSPDGRWYASARDDNIALRATVDGHSMMLTEDGTAEVYWDVETVRWQAWSPDSQRLAVFKIDVTGMAMSPTIHWLKPLEQVADGRFALRAGGIVPRKELYVLNVFGGRPVRVDLGDTTDHYLVELGWLPDGSELLVGRYDRLFKRAEIYAADPTTGASRVVMSDEAETFLSPGHFMFRGDDPGFWILPDGSGFIWRSERDGWSHLYRYDMQGELVAQLTYGEFPVIGVTQIDQKGNWVYFQAHGDPVRVYDNHLYRVSLEGGEIQQLTEGNGRHTIAMAPSCEVFTDTFSSVDTPPQTVLRKADGELLQILSKADISRLEQIGWVPSKEYIVKAADGETDLWVTVHFPYNFDPDKKYPVFEDIYGGPQVMKRTMDFGATRPPSPDPLTMANFPRALAQQGFLVISLDARGTPGRSKAFHDVIYHNWGEPVIADHAGAIRQLAADLPSIDLNRVAVSGASWGGAYTFRAMAQAPEVYKFGIPLVPEYDSCAHTLIEPYLGGLPADDKDVYDAADVLALAPQLKGKMLQITGTNDTSTQNQFFQMSEALIRLGIQHETMIYPNAGHGWFGATARFDNEFKRRWLTTHMQP